MIRRRFEHPSLGLEVFDEPFLPPSEPRSECDDQKLGQRRCLNHVASLPELAASWLFDFDSVFGYYAMSVNRTTSTSVAQSPQPR